MNCKLLEEPGSDVFDTDHLAVDVQFVHYNSCLFPLIHILVPDLEKYFSSVQVLTRKLVVQANRFVLDFPLDIEAAVSALRIQN